MLRFAFQCKVLVSHLICYLLKRADKLCWSSETFLGFLWVQREDFCPLFWNWFFYQYTAHKQSFMCLCSSDKCTGNLQGFTKSSGGLTICSGKNTVQVWALVGAVSPSTNHLLFRSAPKGILDVPKNHRCSQAADQVESSLPSTPTE